MRSSGIQRQYNSDSDAFDQTLVIDLSGRNDLKPFRVKSDLLNLGARIAGVTTVNERMFITCFDKESKALVLQYLPPRISNKLHQGLSAAPRPRFQAVSHNDRNFDSNFSSPFVYPPHLAHSSLQEASTDASSPTLDGVIEWLHNISVLSSPPPDVTFEAHSDNGQLLNPALSTLQSMEDSAPFTQPMSTPTNNVRTQNRKGSSSATFVSPQHPLTQCDSRNHVDTRPAQLLDIAKSNTRRSRPPLPLPRWSDVSNSLDATFWTAPSSPGQAQLHSGEHEVEDNSIFISTEVNERMDVLMWDSGVAAETGGTSVRLPDAIKANEESGNESLVADGGTVLEHTSTTSNVRKGRNAKGAPVEDRKGKGRATVQEESISMSNGGNGTTQALDESMLLAQSQSQSQAGGDMSSILEFANPDSYVALVAPRFPFNFTFRVSNIAAWGLDKHEDSEMLEITRASSQDLVMVQEDNLHVADGMANKLSGSSSNGQSSSSSSTSPTPPQLNSILPLVPAFLDSAVQIAVPTPPNVLTAASSVEVPLLSGIVPAGDIIIVEDESNLAIAAQLVTDNKPNQVVDADEHIGAPEDAPIPLIELGQPVVENALLPAVHLENIQLTDANDINEAPIPVGLSNALNDTPPALAENIPPETLPRPPAPARAVQRLGSFVPLDGAAPDLKVPAKKALPRPTKKIITKAKSVLPVPKATTRPASSSATSKIPKTSTAALPGPSEPLHAVQTRASTSRAATQGAPSGAVTSASSVDSSTDPAPVNSKNKKRAIGNQGATATGGDNLSNSTSKRLRSK